MMRTSGSGNKTALRWELVANFIDTHKGTRIIQRVLIANNGIAAVKEIRSVRRWAYATLGDERAIEFVAMATPEDIAANAEYVRMADEYVAVPGGPNSLNYANVPLIVDIAQLAGVQAVWAGWGHASENPKLPEALKRLGIAFIGPPSQAMQALGDKISSMIVAQSAEIPCLSWSGSGLKAVPDENGRLDSLEPELYSQACVKTVEEGLVAAAKVGFPLMIKASEGGGGKGIRRVDNPADFAVNFDFVQREVPGSPVFLMQLASSARHLEVQVLADEYGQAISLFGRDCSVQRRHQKIIEEAPVTIVKDKSQWVEMERAAVRLAKLVGYVSTGTVEYLYDLGTERFSFLELNPRLQVEHPCTEMVSRVNLPAAQLQVAMGIPLHAIADIRRLYGKDPTDIEPIDFDNDPQLPPSGHVIACRLTAENPEAGFKPGGGRLAELTFRSSANVWGYFSIPAGGKVHEFADSQFGHIFAWGYNRNEARSTMVLALREASIRGEFHITIEYLVKLLETEAFSLEKHSTAWLDSLIRSGLLGDDNRIDRETAVIAGAAWHATITLDGRSTQAISLLKKGQSPPAEFLDRKVSLQFIYDRTQYKLIACATGPDRLLIEMNGKHLPLKVIRLTDGSLLVSYLGNRSLILYGREEPEGLRLLVNGQTILVEKEKDPTVVRSPSPGKLVRFLVSEGMLVPGGTAIAEIEVMKMYMPITIPEAGYITPTKPAGSGLGAGEIIARIKLLDPSAVQPLIVCEEGFTITGPAVVVGSKLHQQHAEYQRILESILIDGYCPDLEDTQGVINRYLSSLIDPRLPFFVCSKVLTNISGRLPALLAQDLSGKLDYGISHPKTKLLSECVSLLTDYVKTCDTRDVPAINNLIQEITPHLQGPRVYAETTLARLCDQFFQDARVFDGAPTNDEVLKRLKDYHGSNHSAALQLYAAYAAGEPRQIIFGSLLKAAIPAIPVAFDPHSVLIVALRKLTRLDDKTHLRISQSAREALMASQLPSLTELRLSMEQKLLSYEPSTHDAFVAELVSDLAYHLDVLPSFFMHGSSLVRQIALEIYIRRVFEAFTFLETSRAENTLSWIVAAPPPAIKEAMASPAMNPSDQFQRRAGAFAAFDSVDAAREGFDALIGRLSPDTGTKNVVYFAIPDQGDNDKIVLETWSPFIKTKLEPLAFHEIKRVTLVIVRANSTLGFYTFREMLGWQEDCQVRHIEPAMSYLLELPRMLHHHTIRLCHADPAGQVHIYKGDSPESPSRLFIRVLIRPTQAIRGYGTLLNLGRDARAIFEDVLDAVAIVQATQKRPLDCNHLYIHVIPTFYADARAAADMFLALMAASEDKLLRLRIMEGEIRMQLASKRGEPSERFRFFLWNETGFVNRVAVYREERRRETDKPILRALDAADRAGLDGSLATAPHAPLSKLHVKRNRVHALETSYVYDFPIIFRRAVELLWSSCSSQPAPPDCLKSVELIADGVDSKTKDVRLKEILRGPGENDIGMVAWKMLLKTPDYPAGRTIIVISNDIDFEIGSFGLAEDRLFAAASKLARTNCWPRIFLSANSGARIGLAEELRELIRAHWLDPTDPTKGFDYLFLEPNDYAKVQSKVCAEPVMDPSSPSETLHYRLTDVLGGLGVENLSGSALIASETSRAYQETFTLTFVTGRSVGIGAYLVRLGQRVIQKQSQPIILTGVAALNQLLGRNVYASNLQIGGPQIMAANGVSHLVVRTDLEGAQAIVRWLDFLPLRDPKIPLAPIEASPTTRDDPERPIAYFPPASDVYDPRLLVTGAQTEDGGLFLGGLLDRNSFVECQSAWARSVVVGRGRLGGLPIAVLLVETRITQTQIPADPASLTSESLTISQAGQVWYPDSAYKTAQFLRDCNYGEKLPLLILANWRGFSGGQRDLFDEILKFGSYIVDALREYRPPVFVYLPPGAQLRGGSWVVVDPAINPRHIEMYAEPSARGGILEAEGLVAIKFRGPQLSSLMDRLVPGSAELPKMARDRLKATMHHVACAFTDLHDRPGRMHALGVIRDVVPWREARRFFYHRLRVKLWQTQLVDRAEWLCHVRQGQDALDTLYDDIMTALQNDWLPSICIDPFSTADADIADALDRHAPKLEARLREWCCARVSNDITSLLNSVFPSSSRTALLQHLLSEEQAKGESPDH